MHWDFRLLRVKHLQQMEDFFANLRDDQCAEQWIFQQFIEKMGQITESYLKLHKLEFDKLFEKDEYKNRSLHTMESLSGAYQFLKYVLERMEKATETDNGKRQLVEKLKKCIEEHLNEELSRTQPSNSVNFLGDYVARVFKMITGKTLSEYIMDRRIERAKEYLLETDMSVGNISYEVGFNNFSYFSKAFKEHTGSTQNEYRMKKRLENKSFFHGSLFRHSLFREECFKLLDPFFKIGSMLFEISISFFEFCIRLL